MNLNDDYVESESWLTERIFSQLKEYNPQERENMSVQYNVPSTSSTIDYQGSNNLASNTFSQTIEGISTENKLFINGSGQTLTYQIGNSGEVAQSQACDNSPYIAPISSDLTSQEISKMAWDVLSNLNDESKESFVVVDADHAQRYFELMKAYVTAPPQIPYEYFPVSENDVVVVKESSSEPQSEPGPETQLYAIQCTHCDGIFEENDFLGHVCNYDENKVLIKVEEDVKSPKREEVEEPPCIRQLYENNIRIRKFLKDELKIDLGGATKTQDGPHECTMCERKFVHASGLVRHMEKHALDLIPVTTNPSQSGSGLKVVIKCRICGLTFFTTADGLQHLSEAHEKRFELQFQENFVKYEEEDEGNLELEPDNLKNAVNFVSDAIEHTSDDERRTPNSYLKVVILNSVLQCEFCDYSFTEVSDLLLHESSHDPVRGFECSSCGISVPTSKEIFLHWQAECPYAKEENKKNINLQRYFVCNVCENKFNSHEQLCDHRYSSYHLFPRLSKPLNIMQVTCEYCGIFHESAKSIMKHHEEKHIKKMKKEATTKYRQYLCDVCGKSYTQSSHLWQHLRFHRGVKPFACKEPGCNRRFTIRPDLNDHIRKCHTGERPYHCLVCGKRFLTGSVFYQHRLIHRGERRYGCEECGKRFYRADALKNHQRIHTGEKPYGCMYCSKSFRQRGDRDKHIRARHANLDANARFASNTKDGIPPPGGVVYVGNVAFPTSMFKPMMRDIDASIYCDK